ncbi:fungal-specific transcription factor domain-containing protein [Roridomyces roridus]|uniref:Fungal-specific transcription factor domain-containing protein n=1 Tax=Roridomyces roridus TaxID=1738132 RepID=A0AAD7CKD8_9AGAR|nr:fungal-specific transcription factor domain-containing protein [Roridomyces roridus]
MSTASRQSRKTLGTRSCDNCRQKKVRCNGPSSPGNQCTICKSTGEPCTYLQPTGKRGPKNKLVDELRETIATLEAKLRSLSVCSLCSQPLESTFEGNSPASSTSKSESSQESPQEEEEEDPITFLSNQFQTWKITTGFIRCKPKYFGSSSNTHLVQSALAAKQKYLGRPVTDSPRPRRTMYWDQLPWEVEFYSRARPPMFPPADLLTTLVGLYFKNIHPTFPVLHRDTFLRDLANGLHETNMKFSAVVLVVLGLASRYSDDPRVMIDGNTISSGWPFVSQAQIVPDPSEPSIHHAQFYSLMTLFVLGGSTPPMGWVYLGIGIRFIQYHGRYRRELGSLKQEDELWNRAFWAIFVLDGLMSCFIGRAPTLSSEEYDVDPPLEVDDEYWDQGFVQPLGRPSALSFFARHVCLFEILGKALRRLHAPSWVKARKGWTVEQQQEAVVELVSMMNDFLESIPAHLRWDANGQGIFFDQSAVLHSTYYWIQITIHRPHIMKRSPNAEPSLFISYTAARSALSVVEAWMTTTQCIPSTFLQNTAFVSAVVLILHAFATKRAGVLLDINKDMTHVRTAMKVFKTCEARWHSAGRLWELLQELQYLDGYLSVRAPPAYTEPEPPNYLPTNEPDCSPESHVQLAIVTEESCFRPGTSIEELLSETNGWEGSWPQQPHSNSTSVDGEFTSLWLAAPADLMNIDQWDSYVENMANVDTNWSNLVV